MRILQVHKYLYPRDGASTYLFTLSELLKSNGHEVRLWGPEEPLKFDRREGFFKDLKKFGHMIWSREAARRFESVLTEWKPDIIHIHNIYHHISPSILKVARRLKIPVVMTVHDYHLINPNYTLYDHGEICERQGLRALANRCIKNSFTATLADVFEVGVHRALGVYKKNIARYIAPTEFVKRKLVEGGIEAGKITVVPLPVEYSEDRPPLQRRTVLPYILFAGRLTKEKGVYVILEIAKRLPDIQFKIAGEGPELARITQHVSRSTIKNIELLGFVEKEKLESVIAGAKLILVPSLWYDPSPFAVLEAMAAGKVVVGSRIGGIPSLIEDQKTGFLLEPGNISQWVDIITKICYDIESLKRIGEQAHSSIKEPHDPEKHYEKIMAIYSAIGH